MERRIFLQGLASVSALPLLGSSALANSSAGRPLNVQVRVFRKNRPGIYIFLPGVPVRLSNGMTGVTSNANGMRGTVHFPGLPPRHYTAQAFVGGRWYNPTAFASSSPGNPPWRIDIQIP